VPPLSGWKRPDDRRKPGAREFHPFGPPRADPIAEAIGPHAPPGAALLGHAGVCRCGLEVCAWSSPGAFFGLVIRPLNIHFPISGSVQPGGYPAVYFFLSLQLSI
jgi:hypothetical protein